MFLGATSWRNSLPDSMIQRFFYVFVTINNILSKPVNYPHVLLTNFQL